MKRLIALVLLVAFLGTVYGGVVPQVKQLRPVVVPQASAYMQWLGPLALPMMGLFAPLWLNLAAPREYAPGPPGVIPVPPVCGLSCLLRPVQGVAK